ncbi:NADPH2:quinone reductase [Caulobacter ginsengisoli]|uniref:NADPH2:quinone reductase n=1 Tax=Caulobacter ginsengisoli TaxID=400775 RepID=A0ABU0IXB7_9CAUL|nr:NADPH:quinone oxidoreductase family protein [Caulobacter ginsengisoli]MDQ0465602.1 NADPH2:quinone reductase [Caulobacter ginsengisoli]
MRLVQAAALDSIADYRLIEVEPPTPGPGQVAVRVKACGVGYVDALVALGRYQVKPPLPHTPGSEIGGVVEALGEGVTGLSIGQRVMAQAAGGFAEVDLAPAAAVTPIPEAMSFEQAAGFRINYLTALHGLADRAAIRPGERLLALGAAGGVGMAAAQVGALLGARVIACASTPEKRAFALAHGAEAAIDTASADPKAWREQLKLLCDGAGPDVIFDPVCGPLFEAAFRSLAWKGRHLVVGFAGGPIPALPANLTLMKGAALVGVDVRQFLLFERTRAAEHLAQLMAWVAEGRLAPPVGRTFAFEDYAEALTFALSGQGLGKTVLRVS